MDTIKPAPCFQMLVLVCSLLICSLFWVGSGTALSQPADTEPQTITMTLGEAVLIGLRQNRTIQSNFLDRVVQKFDLKVEEDKFVPDVDLTARINRTDTTTEESSRTHTVQDIARGTAAVTEAIPTGGTLTFTWTQDLTYGTVQGVDSEETRVSGGEITFTQPLLKDAGINVSMASIKTARLTEEQNILDLKNSVMDTISSMVEAYRYFLQTRLETEVNRVSLERARKLLAHNKLKIAAGQMASVEIVQVEADIAAREYNYESAINEMNTARLSLLKLLAMDKHTKIEPLPEDKIKPVTPDLDNCIALALANNPAYNRIKKDVKKAALTLMLAENNMLWDLSLNSSYRFSRSKDRLYNQDSKENTWDVGLTMSIPIYGDLTRKQTLLGAQTSLQKANLALEEAKNNLEIEIEDRIQNVAAAWKLYELAKKTLTLSEQKLEIEQEKLNAGLSSNFQIVTYQNDLFDAQNNRIEAAINYRNTLTTLDQAIGTTLDTWQIDINKETVQYQENQP